ncbi:unnamed protein product [Closterium sp. NIES-53]
MGTKAVFVDMAPSDGVKHVRGFNGALQPVEGGGTVALQGEAGKRVLIPDMLYGLGVQANLVSASQLKESGVQLKGDGDEMLLVTVTREVLGRARYNGRVLCTDLRLCSTRSQLTEVVALRTTVSATKSTPDRLHARLAHVGVDTIKSSAKHEVATGLDITSSTEADPPCVSCVGGKLARHTFLDKGSDAEEALAVVHIDLCGPFRDAAKDGSLYFLLLKDRRTQVVWVMPVAKKSDVLREFQKWLVLVERQAKKSVLMLHSDRGGEDAHGRRVREDDAAAHGRAAPLVAPRSTTSCLGAQLVGVVDAAAGDNSVPAADQEEAQPHAGACVGLHGAVHGGARLDRQQGGHVGRGDLLRDAVAGWAKFGPASGPTQAHPLKDTSMTTVPLLAEVDEPADEDVVEVHPPPPVLAPPFPVADRPASTPVSATGNEGSLEASPVVLASGIAGGRQGAKLVDQDGKLSKTGEQQIGEPVEQEAAAGVPVKKPELRRTGRTRKPPERLVFHACLPLAAFTTVYDEVDDDLLYDDAEDDVDLPELDPNVHADPEHRWDIATMTGNLKHMERRYDWLQHMVRRGKFMLKYILTTRQPTDFLTKALHFPAFNRCSVAIGQVRLVDIGDGEDDVQQ